MGDGGKVISFTVFKPYSPVRTDQDGKWQIIERIGNGFVAGEETPRDLPALKTGLSEAERLENFEILWEAIDKYYSFFDLKKIDWQEVKAALPAPRQGRDHRRRLSIACCLISCSELKDLHSLPAELRAESAPVLSECVHPPD